MDAKRLTFIVLSSTRGNMRQFKVAPFLIAAALIVFVASLLVGGYGTYYFMSAKQAREDMRGLRREARSHEVQMRKVASELENLKQQITKLNQMDKKIRIIANLQENPLEVQNAGVGGVGPEEGLLQSFQREAGRGVLNRIKEEFGRLKNLAGQQETSFKSLEEQLREKQVLLASTPSIWPTQGWLTCGFGNRQSPFTGLREFHRGVDVAGKLGTPVIAPADGVIVETGPDKDFGEIVRMDHGFGFNTFYGHLSEILVKKGQRVHRGEVIAKVGNTGRTTGPHLHYELYADGIPVNPTRYILN
jgi:murein DD-endopeptidase MepM/ murein hydrolase activator NlpD